MCCIADSAFAAATCWDEYGASHMARDELRRIAGGQNVDDAMRRRATKRVLHRIANSLAVGNRTLEQFGITAETRTPSMIGQYELDHSTERYVADAQAAHLPIRQWNGTTWEAGSGMTAEQAPVFNDIMSSIMSGQPHFRLVRARSGRGKTWLMNLIVATARSRNVVTLCVASTAIAAQAYPGGRTAHSMFNIPVADAASSNANSRKVDCAIDESSTHADFLVYFENLAPYAAIGPNLETKKRR
eukprot:SAG31_NODE_10379_length_1145_cov_4.301147_1_plen_244_part_00